MLLRLTKTTSLMLFAAILASITGASVDDHRLSILAHAKEDVDAGFLKASILFVLRNEVLIGIEKMLCIPFA